MDLTAYGRMDAKGKIEIPKTIRAAMEFEARDVLELRVVGADGAMQLVVTKRKAGSRRRKGVGANS